MNFIFQKKLIFYLGGGMMMVKHKIQIAWKKEDRLKQIPDPTQFKKSRPNLKKKSRSGISEESRPDRNGLEIWH